MLTRIKDSLRQPNFLAGLGVVAVVNVVLILAFYNKGWIPNDDGHYSYVAKRLADGDVLSRDIEELHPGYVHFIHAWSLKIFGTSLVSLRYPLMVLMAAQSLLVYVIFRRTHVLVATTAALAMSTLGALQIVNPTTSLYSLAAAVALAGFLVNTTPETRYRAYGIGFLLGLVFLFRQLTAVFISTGTLAFLTTERQPVNARGKDLVLARILLSFALLGLTGYVLTSGSPTTWILFGTMPLLILAWSIRNATISNVAVLTTGIKLTIGTVVSSLPMVGYHLAHGSLGSWLYDTFIRSMSVNGLEHVGRPIFLPEFIVPALINLAQGAITFKLNSAYWLILLTAAFTLGVGLLRRMSYVARNAKAGTGPRGLEPAYGLPILAVFNAQVSIFIELSYYLYLGAGFSVIGGLWMRSRLRIEGEAEAARIVTPHNGHPRWSLVAGIFLVLIALIFHAGQPFARSAAAEVSGVRLNLVESKVPNLGLWILESEEERYMDLIEDLDARSEEGDLLVTLPNAAEIYFFSGLENDFRIFNQTISLLNQEEIDDYVEQFQAARPDLIVHDTYSSYNIPRTLGILERISEGFELVRTIERFDVYERRAGDIERTGG